MAAAGFLMMTIRVRWLTQVLLFGSERESLAQDPQRSVKKPSFVPPGPTIPDPINPARAHFGESKLHSRR
jgi:hypothetical protein